jgi:Skp family chaperone for outer membrane proteins
VVQSRRKTIGAVTVIALTLSPFAAIAQQGANPEWFVPGQQRPAAGANRPPARPMPQPTPMAPLLGTDAGGQGDDQSAPRQQIQVQLPPPPEIPPVPKGSATPAAIIGILSVPDVLRISTAYQGADKELGVRRQKLNEDAQKEQVALRDLGQALMRERPKMTPEQIRAKEREYEERVNESRRKFGERNRIIQEAGQYVMAQVDRTLEQVAQQVALARGVNLVLNRAQLLGTTTDFDLTPQVADVLNQVLPTVVIPPDGVSVLSMVPSAGAQGPGGITTGPATAAPIGVPPGAAPAPTPAPAAPPATAKPPQKH